MTNTTLTPSDSCNLFKPSDSAESSDSSNFFDFLGLQPELRAMILEFVVEDDLCKMRLVSHQLFLEANEEFERRYLDEITMLGTLSKVRQLNNVLRIPIMAKSTLNIRGLHVSLPTMGDLTITYDVLDDWLLSEKSVRRLLKAIPNLREFSLSDSRDGQDFQYRYEHEIFVKNQAIPDIFLSVLGSLKPKASNLTHLTLDRIDLDGLDLRNVLSTHSFSLRKVEFMSCRLNGIQDQPVTWDVIIHALHTLRLDELFLTRLYDADDEDPLVLHERSLSDQNVENWSSRNPLHRASPVYWQGDRHRSSDYEETDVTNSCAIFSRWEVDLRGSWVKKGIEILLDVLNHNHTLYPDPRDPEDILEG
jgi:hypothetical protein